jgi:hypothetical protein
MEQMVLRLEAQPSQDPPAMRQVRRGRWWSSKINGQCDSCGEPFCRGDRIWLVPYHSTICFQCKVAHVPGTLEGGMKAR